jgi:hypothetical protein
MSLRADLSCEAISLYTMRPLLKLILQALIPYVLVFLCMASIVLFVAYVEWGR